MSRHHSNILQKELINLRALFSLQDLFFKLSNELLKKIMDAMSIIYVIVSLRHD